MQIYNYPNIIPAGTVMNTTFTSTAMQINNQLFYAVQIVFTGTPTGSFALQASCDSALNTVSPGAFPFVVTNWTTIPSSTQAVVAAGSIMWNMDFQAYNFVRVLYTDGSGGASTAIITVSTMNAKE